MLAVRRLVGITILFEQRKAHSLDNRRKWQFILITVLIAYSGFAVRVKADHFIQLSAREQAFLKANPLIRIGVRSLFEPYVIVDEQGKISGYEAGIFALINNRTPRQAEQSNRRLTSSCSRLHHAQA